MNIFRQSEIIFFFKEVASEKLLKKINENDIDLSIEESFKVDSDKNYLVFIPSKKMKKSYRSYKKYENIFFVYFGDELNEQFSRSFHIKQISCESSIDTIFTLFENITRSFFRGRFLNKMRSNYLDLVKAANKNQDYFLGNLDGDDREQLDLIFDIKKNSSEFDNFESFHQYLLNNPKTIELLPPFEIIDLSKDTDILFKENIFPIELKEIDTLSLVFFEEPLKEERDIKKDHFFYFELLLIYQSFVSVSPFRPNEMINFSFLEEAFQTLPYAASLITNKGEILLHNKEFSHLEFLPKDCLELENEVSIDIKNDIYKVIRSEIKLDDENCSFFIFMNDGPFSSGLDKTTTNAELGIISSSLAHELNNPIAGILAAVTLLELEDELSEESFESLSDMKKGATRCKNLIEVFLGFSRARPLVGNLKKMGNSFGQATDLLRFRMVESNVRFSISYQIESNFQRNFNPSIFSMIFYLILNEVITEFSHYNLVLDKTVGTIEATFVESLNQLDLIFIGPFPTIEKVLEQKLINHLLDMEKMKLIIMENKIQFIPQ